MDRASSKCPKLKALTETSKIRSWPWTTVARSNLIKVLSVKIWSRSEAIETGPRLWHRGHLSIALPPTTENRSINSASIWGRKVLTMDTAPQILVKLPKQILQRIRARTHVWGRASSSLLISHMILRSLQRFNLSRRTLSERCRGVSTCHH